MTSELLDSALRFAAANTPVIAVKPRSKEPATPHGVKDATVDPDRIRSWWKRWPDANIGVACGAPGPHVLDVDDPDKYRRLDAGLRAQIDQAPTVATARGHQFYFAGATTGTVVLPFGELRGRGSYVVAPPSVHPTGKAYVWIAEPRGPLPAVPGALAEHGRRAGAGEHQPPRDRLRAGDGRWPYLKDIAVHLVRGGITDQPMILALLWAAFRHGCEPEPPPEPGKLEALAAWAARSDIAFRERAGEAQPPELRHELAQLLRIDPLQINAVRLRGNGPGATLELDLSNGLEVITEKFGDLYSHTGLARFVTQSIGVDAGAITKKDASRANALIRQLADITRDVTTGDLGRDHGFAFLRDAPVAQFVFTDQADRYRAFTRSEESDYSSQRGRRRKVNVIDPADSLVLQDVNSGWRLVRCGHLFEFVRSNGEVAHPGELAKRMVLAGWSRSGKRGRIKATSAATTRVITLTFWRVPPGWEESCVE